MNGGFLRVLRRVVAYWRVIVVLLIFALAAAIVLHNQFVSFELVGLALLLIFIASQIFWVSRVVDLGVWLLRRRVCRRRVAIGVVLAYLFVIAYSFPTTIAQGHTFRIGFYRLPIIVTEEVFWWWFVGSMLAFLLVLVFGLEAEIRHFLVEQGILSVGPNTGYSLSGAVISMLMSPRMTIIKSRTDCG